MSFSHAELLQKAKDSHDKTYKIEIQGLMAMCLIGNSEIPKAALGRASHLNKEVQISSYQIVMRIQSTA